MLFCAKCHALMRGVCPRKAQMVSIIVCCSNELTLFRRPKTLLDHSDIRKIVCKTSRAAPIISFVLPSKVWGVSEVLDKAIEFALPIAFNVPLARDRVAQ